MATPPAQRRLFLGLAVPDGAARRLDVDLLSPLRRAGDGLKVVEPPDLHMTLVFLGPLPEDRRSVLETSIQEEARGLAAPELRIAGTGVFPDRGAPRILWAGVDEVGAPGRLDALRNRMWQAGLSAGWRPARRERERAFHPHVTLARVRSAPREVAQELLGARFSCPWLPVDVVLFESRSPASGARGRESRYQPLLRVPLVVGPG